uniref:Uncharacterized protein n=1 Tax=Ciona intestinalis TaxID=7719 RepID=H2Y2V8_CIOIN
MFINIYLLKQHQSSALSSCHVMVLFFLSILLVFSSIIMYSLFVKFYRLYSLAV